MLTTILKAYGFREDEYDVQPFGTGLINHTWKITHGKDAYILQRVNNNIFKNPADIADNVRAIGEYLKIHSPRYFFVLPIKTLSNEELVNITEGYYRLMPFIKNSRTYDVVSNPQIACEAAREFGCFTKSLAGFDAGKIKITLPDFHNLTLRYAQFEQSLANGNKERIAKAKEETDFLTGHKNLAAVYEGIIKDRNFKKRVTHHDTKISNVLFDDKNQGICVIDLDTTMPGYFISDVGDMMRTYLCPLSEEENNYSKIECRDEYFSAIARGYLQEMKEELTQSELDHFVYAGEFMIYMQAVRFLTDHFNNDVYYGSKYEGHNFVRAKNQIVLLQRYQEKAAQFSEQVTILAGTPINQI
jgi:Ser/Thr protein kinase RdoA (MazF antagonist)